MKHVFLLHSSITFLVAEGVREHRGIPSEDAIYLLSRGYTPPPCETRVVPVEFSHNPESFPTAQIPILSWGRLAEFDRWLDEVVERSDYELYLPQTGQRFMRLLMTHPGCRAVALIEEGLASYWSREVANERVPSKRVRWKDRLAYRGRLGTPFFFDPDVTVAYGINPESFPDFGTRVIVELSLLDGWCPPTFGDGETLVVLCGLSSAGYLDVESDLAGLAEALDCIARRGDLGVRYKLHPALASSPLRHRYHQLLETRCAELDLTVEQLDEGVVLELVGLSCPDVPVVVNLSSAGFYAARAGSQVTSYAALIAARDASFRRKIEEMPPVFLESLTFFEPSHEVSPARATRSH